MTQVFDESIEMRDPTGRTTVRLEPQGANIYCGGGSGAGGDGDLVIFRGGDDIDTSDLSQASIHLNGHTANIRCGGPEVGADGDVLLYSGAPTTLGTSLAASAAGVHLSGGGIRPSIRIGGAGRDGSLTMRSSLNDDRVILDGSDGVFLRNTDGNNTIRLLPESGRVIAVDFQTAGGDLAEEFAIAEDEQVEPGCVMVLDDEGLLRLGNKAYDRCVVGVVSGASGLRPGLVLGRHSAANSRHSITLVGKVNCKATAEGSPIKAGDLLTTSDVKGHVMKAADVERSFGATLGKALKPLPAGRGFIPVLAAIG